MKTEKAKRVAKRIVTRILEDGLAHSTWAEMFPLAFEDLKKHYSRDMVSHAQTILEKVKHDE